MNTLLSIKEDLKNLGVKYGDTIFLRISYKSIGKIEGGPKVFLDAIVQTVGDEGTVILTAFPVRYINKTRWLHRKNIVSELNRPASTTGAMSNVAMAYPGAMFSKRLDFPFVVIGKHAKSLTENHTYDKHGYWILEEAIEKYDCKCLRVGGVPFVGTTHMSLSNTLIKNEEYQMAPRYGLYVKDEQGVTWRENNNVLFCITAFQKYLKGYLEKIKLGEGKIGEGYAIITDMRKSMEEEEKLFNDNIKNVLCDDPNCWVCRSSFSFSDEARLSFFTRQIKQHIRGDAKLTKTKFRLLLEFLFLSTKNQ